MKKVIFLILLISTPSYAETTEDLAKYLFFENSSSEKEILELQALLSVQRAEFIDLYKPSQHTKNIPSDLISLEEQLYSDVSRSDLFKLDIDNFINFITNEVVSTFTHAELLQLKELMSHPVYKKLDAFSSHFEKVSESYMIEWSNKNTKLVESFQSRSEDISNLKIEHLKSMSSENP